MGAIEIVAEHPAELLGDVSTAVEAGRTTDRTPGRGTHADHPPEQPLPIREPWKKDM